LEDFAFSQEFAGADLVGFEQDEKFFEWSNHLGNVLATVSDRKIAHSSNSSMIDYYTADVISAQDYYPFGMIMPGRTTIKESGYRYGFNGMENDDDINGNINTYEFGARIYDARTVSWYSTDPLQKKYPNESPYVFVSRSPILYADKDGRDKIVTITIIGKNGSTTQIQKVDKNYFKYYADARYYGGYYYIKADVHQNLTIDLRNNTRTYTSEVTNRQEISWWDYSVFSDLIKIGDQSGDIKYGYRVFGQGKNMNWQKGLPTASSGSESLDLRDLLDFVGGLREGASPSDLLHEGKLKNVLDKAEKFEEAIEKITNAAGAIKKQIEMKRKDSKIEPDSATCEMCTFKQDSSHIDENNGAGAFKKLRDAKKTEKSKPQ
jgi:RHS repeat-associated protein